jgi:peptidoglycan/LPS O-acetylase OafA/YrhL
MINNNNNIRVDIQGLRTLAVLSVVIFHISSYHVTGGYLGVDIFFVISGYLIMGQIWRALNEHRFSFREFYTKRFRRLLPALVVVLIASSITAYFLLLPGEYRSYTFSVFSSLFYFSNFWFYTKSGYFDAELQTAPLLHNWSLSVEEQFYFPFLTGLSI